MSNAFGPLACFMCFACTALDLGCAPRTKATILTSAEITVRLDDEAVRTLRGGEAERALELADRAVAVSPKSAWAHYDRAVALQQLGRADEAVKDYRDAQRYFGEGQSWGTSLAIYGRARALRDAGRCAEAHGAYEEYATFVRASDPPAADRALAYAQNCREARALHGDRVTSNVASTLIGGDYPGALALAAEASATSPWLEYNRGVALGEVGRTDEAVAAFAAAERSFGSDEVSRNGRAVAIYGRARALQKAGRCAEARRACDEYATFTGRDPGRCRRC